MLAQMRVTVCTEDHRERFDAAVAASPRADVLQSWEWGEVKAATGWDPLRLLIEDEQGRARAACSVLRLTPVRGVPPLLYAPRGPVVAEGDDRALRALLDEIRRRAGNAFLFKCDPPAEPGAWPAGALEAAGLRHVSGGAFGGVQPVAVMVLDLTPGPDQVLAGFKSKWRYNVRLADRKGVVVREGDRDDLAGFHAIYLETAKRDGFVGRGRSYFERLWDVLEPRGMLRMWVAEFDGSQIASIICTMLGERVVYNYGASANEHRNVMPNHLLQWTAIRWAAEKGFKVYDFRGVSPVRDGEPVDDHLAGLNRFKEGFGATYVEYAGEFDLALRNGWYAIWRAAAPTAIKVRARLAGRGPEAAD